MVFTVNTVVVLIFLPESRSLEYGSKFGWSRPRKSPPGMPFEPPPIPADADLRHMPGYMIDVQSLLGSDLAALGDPAANWYALLTWCAAFHQVPAGSLPDDDPTLAYLVRLGRDVRSWKKMREKGAMKGWVKHSDGRFYHPVVTKTVLSLLGKSRAGKTAAGAKQAKKSNQASEIANGDINDRSTIDRNSLQQDANKGREGKGIEGKGREEISALGQTAERQSNLPALILDGESGVPARKSRTKARSSLDPTWSLPEDSRQYARDRGWSEREIDFQFEKFKNHHIAKGNLMADWPAAWRTWVGNGFGPRGPSPGAPARSRADSTAEGILAGMEHHERSDR